MKEVIETNIIYDEYDNQRDFQSRVIGIDNWDLYGEEIKNGESKHHSGTMHGNSLPREVKIEEFKSDSIHLSCVFYNSFGDKSRKLAYLTGRIY